MPKTYYRVWKESSRVIHEVQDCPALRRAKHPLQRIAEAALEHPDYKDKLRVCKRCGGVR